MFYQNNTSTHSYVTETFVSPCSSTNKQNIKFSIFMVSNPKESRSLDKSNLHLKWVRLHQFWKVQPWDDGQVNRHLGCVQSTLPVFPSDRRMFKVHCRQHQLLFHCDCLHQRIRGKVKLHLTMSSPPTSNIWSRVTWSEKASTSGWSIFQNSGFIFRSPALSADEKFMCRDSNDGRLNPV